MTKQRVKSVAKKGGIGIAIIGMLSAPLKSLTDFCIQKNKQEAWFNNKIDKLEEEVVQLKIQNDSILTVLKTHKQ